MMKMLKLNKIMNWCILNFTRYRFGATKFTLADVQDELGRELKLGSTHQEHSTCLEFYITSTGIRFPKNTLPEHAVITHFNLDMKQGVAQIGYYL